MGDWATALCRGRISNAPVVGISGSLARRKGAALGIPVAKPGADEGAPVAPGHADAGRVPRTTDLRGNTISCGMWQRISGSLPPRDRLADVPLRQGRHGQETVVARRLNPDPMQSGGSSPVW